MGLMIITVDYYACATSMALNEFYLYRSRRKEEESNFLVTFETDEETIKRYSDADSFRHSSGRGSVLRRNIEEIVSQQGEQGARVILHCHSPRLALMLMTSPSLWRRGVRVVLTVHSTYNNFSQIRRIATHLSFLWATVVVFCSQSGYDAYPHKRLFRRRLRVVENGVDVDRIDAAVSRSSSGARKVALSMITISRARAEKNIPFLLRVLCKLDADIHLDILGSLDQESQQLIDDGAMGNARALGQLEREEAYSYLSGADMFVSASLYEGLPLGVLEAMALGKGVILSNIASHREIERKAQGRGVLLIDLCEELWVERIAEIARNGGGDLKAMGISAREVVNQHFSLDVMHSRYDAIYRTVLDA